MHNILLSGVGGQGTVLAAKVLAQAAQSKGWHVRTAETIGMAQRGGSVVSHVRIGDLGEEISAPLIALGTADLIIAFEPAEAARALPYLASGGVLVTATTAIQPVSSALSKEPYKAQEVIEGIKKVLEGSSSRVEVIDDLTLTDVVGTRKVLNTLLLTKALMTDCVPLDIDDLMQAIKECVKPRFVELNLLAVDVAQR